MLCECKWLSVLLEEAGIQRFLYTAYVLNSGIDEIVMTKSFAEIYMRGSFLYLVDGKDVR